MKLAKHTYDRPGMAERRFLRRRCLQFAPALVLAGLLAGTTGCKTTRQVSMDMDQTSGFLKDYSQLQPGTNGQAAFVYIDPSADWAKYTKIMVKPLELWQSDDPDSNLGKLDDENKQDLMNMFATAVHDAVATTNTGFTLVDQPGPAVIILHAALTDAKKSKPVANFITSVYLPLKVISFGKRLITGTDIAVGKVTVEAELLDGATNKRIAAAVDQRAGTKAVRTKFNSTWGDVRLSFEFWAERLVMRLNEEKVNAPEKTQL